MRQTQNDPMERNREKTPDVMSQMDLLEDEKPIVHYFDKNGALRSGRMVRRIQSGDQKGAVVVEDITGRRFIPEKIRNIE